MSVDRGTFGGRLKECIKSNDCSRSTLASLLGVHVNTIGHWIRNEKDPGLNRVRLIAQFLDVELTWLITGESAREYADRKRKKKSFLSGESEEESGEDVDEICKQLEKLNAENVKFVAEMIRKLLASQGE